jgi:L-arabinose isomerase
MAHDRFSNGHADIGIVTTEALSFEVTDSGAGDLLSRNRLLSRTPLKIGLVATSYFEFYRMYDNLQQQIHADAQKVYVRLSSEHDVICAPIVDTLDSADEAGRRLRAAEVDVLILAYRAYVPDAYIHHLLTYLPGVPILFFASQSRDRFDYTDDYGGVLRNSGIMAQVQLVAGFKKMGRHDHIEAIAGCIDDEDAYQRINQYLKVVTIYKQLRTMTFGVIGNVFRGMFDFEYDKTKIKGALGPEVLSIQADHLERQWKKAPLDDPDVQAMLKRTREQYDIVGVQEGDLQRAARLAVAIERLVDRFQLDGLAVLCQHFIEAKFKATPYLGLCELHRDGRCPASSEGDVIGLITMKILKHLTGNMPFFVEWSEFDVQRNAWMLLGHGFGDPSQAQGRATLTPTAEQWGLESRGAGCSGSFAPKPGPCTMAHFIEDAVGWRMFISEGEILDLPAMPINDVHVIVRVEKPITQYTEELIKLGVPHHAITVRGSVRKELEQLAGLMGISTTIL